MTAVTLTGMSATETMAADITEDPSRSAARIAALHEEGEGYGGKGGSDAEEEPSRGATIGQTVGRALFPGEMAGSSEDKVRYMAQPSRKEPEMIYEERNGTPPTDISDLSEKEIEGGTTPSDPVFHKAEAPLLVPNELMHDGEAPVRSTTVIEEASHKPSLGYHFALLGRGKTGFCRRIAPIERRQRRERR